MEDPLVNPLEDLVPEEAEGDDARELQHGRRGDKQEATLRGGSTREVDVADGGAKAEEPSGKGLTSQAEEEVGERAAPCQERDPASPASQVSRLTEQMSRAVSGAPVPSLPTDSSTNNSSTSSPPPRSSTPRSPWAAAAAAATAARNGAAAAARDGINRLAISMRTSFNEKTDQENRDLLAQLQQHMNSPPEKVSFLNIAKNRSLAQAAKMELNFGSSLKGGASSFSGGEEGGHKLPSHDLEVQRHRAVTEEVEEDAQHESSINKEMLDIVVEKMKSARRSCEAYGRMFAGMAMAENAYAKAMEAVARDATKPVMTSESGSGMQEGANVAILELPMVISKAHAAARDALKEESNTLHALDVKYQESLKLITADAAHLARSISTARQDLRKALETHEMACEAVDALHIEGTAQGRVQIVENDPWVTESLLAKAHADLRTCLQEERCSMEAAYSQLRELELERAALNARLSRGCFDHYRAASVAVHDRAVDLSGAIRGVDMQPEIQGLMEAAEQAAEISRELAAKQAENLEGVATELFCSPEILRQGLMEVWKAESMEWAEQHFVLTRSGFLHWFESTDHLLPVDAMNLGRCSIEAGEPPIFSLQENMVVRVPLCGFPTKEAHGPLAWAWTLSRERKVSFKAADIDDCCEWVIAIREEIASKGGK